MTKSSEISRIVNYLKDKAWIFKISFKEESFSKLPETLKTYGDVMAPLLMTK